jgi:hypothetical protein
MKTRLLPVALGVAMLGMTGCGSLRNLFSCKGDACGAIDGPPSFVGPGPMMGSGCGECCGSYGSGQPMGYMGETIVSPPATGGWQSMPPAPPMSTMPPSA